MAEWWQPAGAAVAQARRITETLSSRPGAVTLWRGRTLDADAKGVDSNSQAQAAQEGPHGTASSAAIQACEGAGTAVAGTAVATVPSEGRAAVRRGRRAGAAQSRNVGAGALPRVGARVRVNDRARVWVRGRGLRR